MFHSFVLVSQWQNCGMGQNILPTIFFDENNHWDHYVASIAEAVRKVTVDKPVFPTLLLAYSAHYTQMGTVLGPQEGNYLGLLAGGATQQQGPTPAKTPSPEQETEIQQSTTAKPSFTGAQPPVIR